MTRVWTRELEQWIQAQALEAGFDTSGIATVDRSPNAGEDIDAQRFTTWIEAGHAGEMDYLKSRSEDGQLIRSAVKVPFPWARSIIVCVLNYNSGGLRSIDAAPDGSGWIARYAWSGRSGEIAGSEKDLLPTDYHEEMLARLRKVEGQLQERLDCETRCYVDTGPVVERTLAARAGIGWIGKNTCVLTQELGSWLLLGVIVTSIQVGEGASLSPAADRCGSCTRCIDACPTDALIAPREMDASRCIAYLTIEKKGEIAGELRAQMGRQVFGCDICQDVCPWNKRSPISAREGNLPRKELVNPKLGWLASMDAQEFRRWFKGSPLERTRRKRLHRNVAIAMGNSLQAGFLPQLDSWANGDDPVLADAARWASDRIRLRNERDSESPD